MRDARAERRGGTLEQARRRAEVIRRRDGDVAPAQRQREPPQLSDPLVELGRATRGEALVADGVVDGGFGHGWGGRRRR
jgi:hypothetical protein